MKILNHGIMKSWIKSITVRNLGKPLLWRSSFQGLGSLQTFQAVLLSSISEMGPGTRTPQRLRLSLSRGVRTHGEGGGIIAPAEGEIPRRHSSNSHVY